MTAPAPRSIFTKMMSRKALIRFLLAAAVAVSISLMAVFMGWQTRSTASPLAEGGVLDLGHWDFSRHGIAQLDGQWEFYWKALYSPEDFGKDVNPLLAGHIILPGPWNGYRAGTGTIGSDGYGTYRLMIKLPKGFDGAALALRVPFAHSAYRLWINGREESSNGKVGATPGETRPFQVPRIVYFRAAGESLTLVMQVANFHQRAGGVLQHLRLGAAPNIVREREGALAVMIFFSGCILIIALYHLGIYVLRKEDRANLFFALFCLVIIIRMTLTGEKMAAQTFPDAPWEFFLKLEYLTLTGGISFFLLTIQEMYRKDIQRIVTWILQVITWLYSLFVIAAPTSLFSKTLIFFQAILVAGSLYSLLVLIKAVINRREGAMLNLLGIAVLYFTLVNDILATHLVAPRVYMIPLGLMALILTQSASALRKSFRERDRLLFLNRELEISRDIQQAIISREVPALAAFDIAVRYLPMDAVGGDFYDFHVIDGDRIGIFMSDVAGHGIPASLIASMVKIGFTQQHDHAGECALLLSNMNRTLLGAVGDRYVTACYLYLDAASRIVRTSRAGHPPALMKRAADNGIITLDCPGQLLGAFSDPPFHDREFGISSGDFIILYTDGFTEARNSQGEPWGAGRLIDSVNRVENASAESIADALVSDVTSWSGWYKEFEDDLTLIVVEVR